MRMFRFVGEDGNPACVDIYRIVGFGEKWPESAPKQECVSCTITYATHHFCVIVATSESFDDLVGRYEDQILAAG